MVTRILQILSLSCRHRKTSQPFTAASPRATSSDAMWDSVSGVSASHYIVCLDCGKKFQYDWDNMRIVS